MYVLSLVFCSIANKMLAKLASYVVRDLRTEIDVKMHRMKLNYFDSHTNGETLSIITNDVDAVNRLLGKNIYTVITQAIFMAGVLIMLLTTNVWLALIAVLMIPGTLLLTGRTSFVIAHRLSTIRDASAILYMENGDIKEVGDHDTLMKLNGKYAALYNSQFA